MPPLAGMHIYINGVLEDSYTKDSNNKYHVGGMYKHTGYASIGAIFQQGKIHTKKGNGPPGMNVLMYYFKGKIGEFLYYNKPSMTEARVRILHNYLASNYKLPLNPGIQDFNLAYVDNTLTLKNWDMMPLFTN